jgi:hypothetical protein
VPTTGLTPQCTATFHWCYEDKPTNGFHQQANQGAENLGKILAAVQKGFYDHFG